LCKNIFKKGIIWQAHHPGNLAPSGANGEEIKTNNFIKKTLPSFPLKLASYPELAEWGAYSPHKVYTVENIRELVTTLALSSS